MHLRVYGFLARLYVEHANISPSRFNLYGTESFCQEAPRTMLAMMSTVRSCIPRQTMNINQDPAQISRQETVGEDGFGRSCCLASPTYTCTLGVGVRDRRISPCNVDFIEVLSLMSFSVK